MGTDNKSLIDYFYKIPIGYFDDFFWPKVRKTDTCWWWHRQAASGYGQFSVRIESKQVTFLAHRVAYELVKGFIGTGLVVDHTCLNTLCVNPSHLEAVSQRTNLLRSDNFISRNIQVTHCPQGHEYTAENCRTKKDNRRSCKTCHRIRERARRDGKVYNRN